MVRRFFFVAVAAVFVAVWPSSGYAATAPAAAPVLTSGQYLFPVSIHWTPGADILDISQSVYRSSGACGTPAATTVLLRTLAGNGDTDYTDRPGDGTYCYFIQAADALLGTANSPGVTAAVDTANPTATVAVANAVGGVVTGTVGVSGTSGDAVSGVASSVFHAGPVGSCPSGPVVGPTWDTTPVANGVYAVCNVVSDNAGHVAVASTNVIVSNALPPPAQPGNGPIVSIVPAAAHAGIDQIGPKAPTKLAFVVPRSKPLATQVRVTLHWVKPTAPDLARVVVVLNLKHPPTRPSDGSKVYSGLKTSVVLNLPAAATGYVALYAYDLSGNASQVARSLVALAPLIPLRPVSGSSVAVPPVLTWKPARNSAYYNVQLYLNGRRVLTGWPSTASYKLPAGGLAPGNYVWYVWPAVRHSGASPTFGLLIGRATFVLKR